MFRLALIAVIAFGVRTSGVATPDIYDGRPAFGERDQGSYYVWRDGNTWHVRWIAVNKSRQFKGSVSVDSGSIGSLRQIDPFGESRVYAPWLNNPTLTVTLVRPGLHMPDATNEFARRIRKDGDKRIIFDARVRDKLGGFDFVPDDGASVLTFNLQLDRKSEPQSVKIGKDAQQPAEIPFKVNLK